MFFETIAIFSSEWYYCMAQSGWICDCSGHADIRNDDYISFFIICRNERYVSANGYRTLANTYATKGVSLEVIQLGLSEFISFWLVQFGCSRLTIHGLTSKGIVPIVFDLVGCCLAGAKPLLEFAIKNKAGGEPKFRFNIAYIESHVIAFSPKRMLKYNYGSSTRLKLSTKHTML